MAGSLPTDQKSDTVTRHCPNGERVTPPEQALIVAYHGVGLTFAEIGTRLTRDPTTVREVVIRLRKAAREADDPLDVFAEAVGPALATDPDAGGEA